MRVYKPSYACILKYILWKMNLAHAVTTKNVARVVQERQRYFTIMSLTIAIDKRW